MKWIIAAEGFAAFVLFLAGMWSIGTFGLVPTVAVVLGVPAIVIAFIDAVCGI